MGRMDQICSGCQAGMCNRDHSQDNDLHPDDRGTCVDCGETYNRRSARLNSDRCPSCDRKRDERIR